MARKNLSIDEQIIQAEEALKEKIRNKRAERPQELNKIYQIIVSSGKGFDEIKTILKAHE